MHWLWLSVHLHAQPPFAFLPLGVFWFCYGLEVEVRGYLAGISSLLLSVGPSSQTWCQLPLPTEPAHQSKAAQDDPELVILLTMSNPYPVCAVLGVGESQVSAPPTELSSPFF